MKTVLIYSFIFSLLSACVGTVEDLSEDVNNNKPFSEYGIEFDGIETAIAVAHNKVDISFKPALGGSGNFSYIVYQNGNYSTPVASLPDESDLLDADGFYHVQVGSLAQATSYSFAVRVFDSGNNVYDENTKNEYVTTLGYLVPVFNGVLSVDNLPGLDGENKLRINWNQAQPAAVNSNPFGSNPHDISGYNIYMGLAPETMTLTASVTDPEQTSLIVTGLTTGTNFFVRVRAKNKEAPPKEDLNIKYIQKATLTPQTIVFDGLQDLTIPQNNAGYNNLSLKWNAGSGSFDRYRIFLSTTPKAAFDPSTDSAWGSDITDLTLEAIDISASGSPAISAHTDYWVALIACRDAACTTYTGNSNVKTTRTSPPVALFNGIKTIGQPSGAEGLNALDLTWDQPDTTAGVYNTVKIFLSDRYGNYNELVDQLPAYDSSNPSQPGYVVPLTTLTGTRVDGLQTDTEYCLVAKAYATSPFDASNPNGRTHTNKIVKCATPQYVTPNFGGLDPSCTNATSSSLKVSWSTPTQGLYDRYDIWAKANDGSGFSFTDAIAGDTDYIHFVAASDKVNTNLTGLSPNSTYLIGARTFFYDPVADADRYDSNIVTATCSTDSARVEFQSWQHAMAIGPKIDNRTNPPAAVLESIISAGTDAIPVDRPEENIIGSAGIDASKNGIVKLVWKDFTLTGGLGRMYDYPASTNGYNVYRMPWIPAHDTLPPARNDSSWGSALNTAPIASTSQLQPDSTIEYLAEFVDYTLPDRLDMATKGKTYWYKVEAILNNQIVPLDTLPQDYLLKVVAPPNNMAFVHRWMANKDVCEKMGLTIDRANNYRCVFNGLSNINGYYDMEADILIDRFEVGCDFSRGTDPAKKCSGSHSSYEGETTDIGRGITAGDCIGTSSPTGMGISAAEGSVFYNRNAMTCYYNNSAGNNWVELYSIEGQLIDQTSTKYPDFDATYFPGGRGIGSASSTSNAHSPPLTNIVRNQAYRICQSKKIQVDNTEYFKRLPRRKEWLVSAHWKDNLDASNLEYGNLTSGSVDKDCNSVNPKGGATVVNLNSDQYAGSVLAMLATGSTGDQSSAGCVSKFGLQDAVGNVSEFLSDTAHQGGQGSMEPYRRIYGWYDYDQTTPMSNLEEIEPGAAATWKNGDGLYYVSNYRTCSNCFGGGDRGTNPRYSVVIDYISIPLGIPMRCNGGVFCGGGNDDNTIVTAKTSFGSASITRFKAHNGYAYQVYYGSSASIYFTPVAGGWIGYAGSGIYNFYERRTLERYNVHGFRCGVLLED